MRNILPQRTASADESENIIAADKIRFTRSPNACSRRACHRCDFSRLGRARAAAGPISSGVGEESRTVAACNLASARYGPLGSSDGALSLSQLRPCLLSPERRVMRAAVQSPFAEDPAVPPRRGNQRSKQNQPELRLISGENRADVGSFAPRLAAIVAVDMVDYTRHMASDEAGTHARYAALRRNVVAPGLARHGARIIKHTGDGFMAEFSSATQCGVVRGQVPGRRSCLECSPRARKTPRVSRRHKPGRCDRGGA